MVGLLPLSMGRVTALMMVVGTEGAKDSVASGVVAKVGVIIDNR